MDERIDKLTSRHIARCLDFLGETIAPSQAVSIKRSFRFLADDIKQVINEETSNGNQQENPNR
jgi:hypothetical protein